MNIQREFIIYGLGKRGKIYYNFFKNKKLENCIVGFCDQQYQKIEEYDGKKCYGYDDAKMLGIPFLISVFDQNVFLKIEEQIRKDGNSCYGMDNIADYLGEDKVKFNRDYIAYYHDSNMEDYYCDAQDKENMDIFWREKSDFHFLFCQLNLTNVIELACGRGRHVEKYIDRAENITLVDILEQNINFCKDRFYKYRHVHYYCNNGFNLEKLPSGTYTALFSYDAMVHFEMMDIYEYLKDIYRVLIDGGRVLIHHSNYDKDYKASFINSPHGRSYMNSSIFAYMAFRVGFRILEQKAVAWGGVEGMDCISLLEK